MTPDLRLGRWQDVLADVVSVDAIITDPPYSARTHEGNDFMPTVGRAALGYEAMEPAGCLAMMEFWNSRVSGWVVVFSDDVLVPHWRAAAEGLGRLAFASLPVIQHRPRLGGDGPGSCAVYLNVSRPRRKEFQSWGSLPGWYHSRVEKAAVNGAKPLELMRALVRDYSRPGDLICDPCAGGGTTGLAAILEGRRFIGAEMDPATHKLAAERLRGLGPSSPTQPNLFDALRRP